MTKETEISCFYYFENKNYFSLDEASQKLNPEDLIKRFLPPSVASKKKLFSDEKWWVI